MKSILDLDPTNKAGGIPYTKLTDSQKEEVRNNFFNRALVGSEKTDFCRYHFNGKGKCTHYT